MSLRSSEWVAVAYFLFLAAASLVAPLEGRRRARIVAASAAMILAIGAVALSAGDPGAGSPWALLARDWVFPAYILASYWLPAQFVSSINERAEKALRSFDRRWADRLIDAASRAPRVVTELAELAYAFCYPMIPGGFAVLALGGFESEADRYWTALMWAAGLSYGALPWMPTRPPRVVEARPCLPAAGVRRLNLLVLGHASVQLNTFPSGHVATAVAAALAVGSRMPGVGAALGGLAAAIAVACVVRRYHYAADALAGVLVACVAFVLSRLA